MKSNYLAILIALSLFSYSCKEKNDNCIKGRVVRISCASFVVQVLDKDSVGDYGWRDVGGHAVYNNVFTVSNSCRIGKWFKGENIYFTIKDTSLSNTCPTCMMFDSPPENLTSWRTSPGGGATGRARSYLLQRIGYIVNLQTDC